MNVVHRKKTGEQGIKIHVEVAYALPEKQQIVELDVEEGSTAYDAAVASDIVLQFEGVPIDLDEAKMGIFGKGVKSKEYVLRAGDRVEIYRPLIADPKAVRKARAASVKEKK